MFPGVLALGPILVLGAAVTPATAEEIALIDDIVTAGQRPGEPTTEEVPVEQRVPDLGGMDLTRAENALAAAGFALGRVSRQPSTGAIGTVIDQSPAAGALAAPRSTVDLTLALPSGPFAMPDPGASVSSRRRSTWRTMGSARRGSSRWRGAPRAGPS